MPGLQGSAERAGAAAVLGSVPVLTKTADAIGDTGGSPPAFEIIELLVEGSWAGTGRCGDDGGRGRTGRVRAAEGVLT